MCRADPTQRAAQAEASESIPAFVGTEQPPRSRPWWKRRRESWGAANAVKAAEIQREGARKCSRRMRASSEQDRKANKPSFGGFCLAPAKQELQRTTVASRSHLTLFSLRGLCRARILPCGAGYIQLTVQLRELLDRPSDMLGAFTTTQATSCGPSQIA